MPLIRTAVVIVVWQFGACLLYHHQSFRLENQFLVDAVVLVCYFWICAAIFGGEMDDM